MKQKRSKEKKGKEVKRMKINVNLDDVKELKAIPAGEYVCKVYNAEVKSSAKGDYIAWQLMVDEGDYKGAIIFNNTSLLPQALFNLKRFLSACNFEWAEEGFDAEDVYGCEVVANVALEDYQGKEVNKIKGFMPV